MAANLPTGIVQKILSYASGSQELVRDVYKSWSLAIQSMKWHRFLDRRSQRRSRSSRNSEGGGSGSGINTPEVLYENTDDGFD